MQITITTKQMLNILYVLAWIIFVGLCVEAGGLLFNAIFTMVNPAGAKYIWREIDLSGLYKFNSGYFLTEMIHIIIVEILKTILLYLVVKILHERKVNLSQPFNKEMGRFIFNLSYLALFIGVFCWWGVKYTAWLAGQGAPMPDIQYLRLDGADVWLFMGVTLYVIAQIFKRGIEIQTENELTV